MKTGLRTLAILSLSAVAGWWIASILSGTGSGWPAGGALMAVCAAAAALAIVGRASSGWLVAAGLLTIGMLFLPITLYAAGLPDGGTSPFGIPMTFTSAAIIGAGILAAAALLHAGLSREAVRTGPLVMGGLVLVFSFVAWFWLVVWDSSYDPIGLILISILVLCASLAGLALLLYLPRRRRVAGLLFALLVPAGLVLVMALVQRAGFRHITETRAGHVVRALESYHAREGNYPDALRQLVPRDTLFISRPLVLFGQDWCYEAEGDSYQLGYVDREHWSDPRLFGRVAGVAGDNSSLDAPCASEMDNLMRRFPDYFVLRE